MNSRGFQNVESRKLGKGWPVAIDCNGVFGFLNQLCECKLKTDNRTSDFRIEGKRI